MAIGIATKKRDQILWLDEKEFLIFMTTKNKQHPIRFGHVFFFIFFFTVIDLCRTWDEKFQIIGNNHNGRLKLIIIKDRFLFFSLLKKEHLLISLSSNIDRCNKKTQNTSCVWLHRSTSISRQLSNEGRGEDGPDYSGWFSNTRWRNTKEEREKKTSKQKGKLPTELSRIKGTTTGGEKQDEGQEHKQHTIR